MNETIRNDSLTKIVLDIMRYYEIKYDITIDCSVAYGHYANVININGDYEIIFNDETDLQNIEFIIEPFIEYIEKTYNV